jgi:hypothetical protein
VFYSVEVGGLDSPETVGVLQRLWVRHRSERLPFYLIVTPRGTELFAGRLDLASVDTLAASPRRLEMAKFLSQGKQGVVVLLLGVDEAANRKAKETVSVAVAVAAQRGFDAAMVTVARTDPRERWFVRQLLELEDDLTEIDVPMVFGVFGRGHALEPCIGAGITQENIVALIQFINGPCTCEVKAQNPGMDLLTNWDWQTQIAKLPGAAATSLHSALYDILVIPAPTAGTADPDAPRDAIIDAEGPVVFEPNPPAPVGQVPPEMAPANGVQAETPAAPSPAADGSAASAAGGPLDARPAAAPAAEPTPARTSDADATPVARVPDVVKSPPAPPPAPAADDDPSLASVVGPRLGVALGAMVLLAAVIGIAIARRKRDA